MDDLQFNYSYLNIEAKIDKKNATEMKYSIH